MFVLSGAPGVNSPGSGWYAGNPLLGPSNLTTLATAGGTTYAAGDLGTLLKSTDGGATWSGIVTGIQDIQVIVHLDADALELDSGSDSAPASTRARRVSAARS